MCACEKLDHLLLEPEAASAAVGKSVEGGTLVCVMAGTAQALAGVADDADTVAGISTGDGVEMSDGLLDLSWVASVSCFFSDASGSACGCSCCCEREGELEAEPQPCDVAGEAAGTSVPTACSLLKLGRLMGRGADILLESSL